MNPDKESNILAIDFEDDDCQEFINRKAVEEGSECLKFSSIIFLESQDYRSSSPKQNKIKGVPVLTVHTRDAKDIRKAFQKDKTIQIDILYDTLDKMMENLDGESELKKRSCNELADPKEAKASIAFEKENAADGKLYLGQDSNVKVKSKLEITCTVYGRDCTALAAWKKQSLNMEKMKNFEVDCREVKMNYKNV